MNAQIDNEKIISTENEKRNTRKEKLKNNKCFPYKALSKRGDKPP